MGRKKLLPGIVLLVRSQFIDPRLRSPLLLDWVVSLIRYGDTREFVFSLLTSIQSEDLILLILVKTQMAVVFYRAVRELARSPNQAALFGAFLTHEQHSRGVPAIRPGRLLLMNPTARKIGAVGDCESHRPIRLDDIDAAGGEDSAEGNSPHRRAAQNSGRKRDREHARGDCKEAGAGQRLHESPL